MLNPARALLGRVASSLALVVALFLPAARALGNQGLIARDGTLGTGTLELAEGIDPNGNHASYLITPELGEQHGSNLFHSFERFGIGGGETATFTGPDPLGGPQSVANVISRVSGGAASQLDGTLRSTIPGADVWLINPSGLVFGPGATLDVLGSFHAATADALGFDDTGLARFYADLSRPSVLSIAEPRAFGFLGAAPSGAPSLRADWAHLAVPEGETLSLVAREALALNGGSLTAENGRVNLAAVASAGDVILRDAGAAEPLDAVSFTALGDIALESSRVSVEGSAPGQVFIRGGRVVIANYSLVFAQNFGPGAGGRIDVLADRSLDVDKSYVFTRGSLGAPGTIDVEGGSIRIVNGGNLLASCEGCVARSADRAADAGLIRIDAADLTIEGSTGQPPPPNTNPYWNSSMLHAGSSGAMGDAGRIELTVVGALRLTNGGLMFAGNDRGSTGAAGSISIQAGSLEVGSRGLIHVGTSGPADAGTIEVVADSVHIGREGVITTNSFSGAGNAGTIDVRATRSILIDHEDAPRPSFLELWSGTSATNLTGLHSSSVNGGNAGAIYVEAPEITVLNGAAVTTTTVGGAAAGDVWLQGERVRILDGGGVGSVSFVNPFSGLGGSSAGNVTILADESIEVSGSHPLSGEASSISTATFGSGTPGDVFLRAPRILVDGGSLATTALPYSDGREGVGGGSIGIEAGDLTVRRGGRIDATTFVAGDGGSIAIDASGTLSVEGGSEISARSGSDPEEVRSLFPRPFEAGLIGTPGITGDAGSIAISALGRLQLNGGGITTSASGGDGGNIAISTDLLLMQAGSRILAQAGAGNGGNINIQTSSFFPSADSVIDASSSLGIDGTVVVRSPEADLPNALGVLPSAYLDPTTLLRERCAARRAAGRAGSFTVRGPGTPAAPDAPLAANALAYAGGAPATALENVAFTSSPARAHYAARTSCD